MNLGAVVMFAKRAGQIAGILMLGLNTIKIAGMELRPWMWIVAVMILAAWIVLDVRTLFPQEMDYSVRKNKTLMRGLNLK